MKKQSPLIPAASLFLFLLSSCSLTGSPDQNQVIRDSVAATLAAIPTSASVAVPTAYPSPTALVLNGLFCEYQFCIGHPVGMAFYDHFAALNPQNPSHYGTGFLVSYQVPTLVINVIWLEAPGTADPQFLLDTIMDEADTRSGKPDTKLIRGMNVVYTSIATSISADVPFGGAGAWTCGDRIFAWKAYVPNAEAASPLFEEALARFNCSR